MARHLSIAVLLASVVLTSGCLEETNGASDAEMDVLDDVSDADTDADTSTSNDPPDIGPPNDDRFACNPENLSSVSEAKGAVGSAVKVPAYVLTGDFLVCESPEQQDCVSALSATDESGTIHLGSASEARFGCYGEPFTKQGAPCVPLFEGVEYFVWGDVVSGFPAAPDGTPSPFEDVASDPVPPVIAVTGFCLRPTPQGFTGSYDGVLEVNGTTTALVVRIGASGVIFSSTVRLEGGDTHVVDDMIDAADGTLALSWNLDDLGAAELTGTLSAELRAERNSFISTSANLDGEPARLRLTRVGR